MSQENNDVESSPKVAFGMNVNTALSFIRKEFSAILLDEQRKNKNSRVEVCVTGSLYIVGSALEAAGWEENSVMH